MTQLLIVGSTIIAQGPLTQDASNVYATDAIYPKHVINGYQLVEAELPAGFTCAGYEWINGALSQKPPVVIPPVVPESVSRFQARMALRNAELFDAVETMMADPATPIIAVEAWQTGQEFRRASATVQAMAAALGLTDQQLDGLFIAAAEIEA